MKNNPKFLCEIGVGYEKTAAWVGLKVQRVSGQGKFVISGQRLSNAHPIPYTKKILTGFLSFAWTPLGSSGAGDP